MRLLLPSISKLKSVYCLLLLKAISSNSDIVTWNDVRDAVSIVSTATKGQVKKYLLMMVNHAPPLLAYKGSTIFDHFYRIYVYSVDDGGILRQSINFARDYRNDIVLAIADEETENVASSVDLLKKGVDIWQEKSK